MEESKVLEAYNEIIKRLEFKDEVSEQIIYDIIGDFGLSSSESNQLYTKLSLSGIDIVDYNEPDLSGENDYLSRDERGRINSAQIARIFAKQEYLNSGTGFFEYIEKKFGLKRSVANDYKRVGQEFLKKDSEGLPDIAGETIFKERYGFERDFGITQLRTMLSLSSGEIKEAIEEYGLSPEGKITDIKTIIDKVHVKKRGNDPKSLEKQFRNKLAAFQKLSSEEKDRIFENEVERRYGMSLLELKQLIDNSKRNNEGIS